MNVELFFNALRNNEIEFFSGVPDSLLKSFCAYLNDAKFKHNYTTACEGGAMAMAIGYHLQTNNIPCVFMQNSGLGNIVNPLLSLADDKVYSIPMLMVIGWRGEISASGEQVKDEPQHKKQGLVTLDLLEAMGVEYKLIEADTENVNDLLSDLVTLAQSTSRPVAIVVRKDTFEAYKEKKPNTNKYLLKREDAIATIIDNIDPTSKFVATTGMISRELFELRVKNNEDHSRDFLTVGGMGFASQIAAGIASNAPHQPIYCLDGDGAFLMHMGSLVLNSGFDMTHIVLNNEAHDSVGGQATKISSVNIPGVALACGYTFAKTVLTKESLKLALEESKDYKGARIIEVKVAMGARSDLGRPTLSSKEMKALFMSSIDAE
ncbi:phosphonopyruvate decarboxylase [Vibrio kasasachensis]|uniref:phosphonopyruvate decarboxylase n=1 Tax=Vibrio kasasachensis TaxID=2910248 RepID=UPI003D0AC51B